MRNYDLTDINDVKPDPGDAPKRRVTVARHDYRGKSELDMLLTFAVNIDASDIHLTAGIPPAVRLHGRLWKLTMLAQSGPPGVRFEVDRLFQINPAFKEPLKPERIAGLCQPLLKKEPHGVRKSIDMAYAIPDVSRFRVNLFQQRGTWAAAWRVLSSTVKDIRDLFPYSRKVIDRLAAFATMPRGLVLVTGPTGSGKTTTLAAMISYVNRTFENNIITLEDPIEYVHQHGRSIVNQRELHSDVDSFAEGLRAALREDPDIIMVGEMRDRETISTAITAAETGHLVLSTLHTNTAAETVARIIDVFPPHQQQQSRVQLASVLQGVISQQLLPRADGKGRVCAVEIMAVNNAIRSLIQENKIVQIPAKIQTGAADGMVLMDQSLGNLVSLELITEKEAMAKAVDVNLLRQYLG
ncbi:Twitching mobility protein [Pelotomaculum schinkii]|uniref:Twitching mobility protein n=1 Tax=Pelotomaculum schinkii TaxID=78350 RepID=A0A4Y7R7W1_9FIRM|nr:PilT/PilU family type 4a pilus ATPase [Pelotomaculum schinkii]TEB04731.1 Twitching mobility protein [Pelotomaculum schinkii]